MRAIGRASNPCLTTHDIDKVVLRTIPTLCANIEVKSGEEVIPIRHFAVARQTFQEGLRR